MQMARPEASLPGNAKENARLCRVVMRDTQSLLPTPALTLANGNDVHICGEKHCWAASRLPSTMEIVLPVSRVGALC